MCTRGAVSDSATHTPLPLQVPDSTSPAVACFCYPCNCKHPAIGLVSTNLVLIGQGSLCLVDCCTQHMRGIATLLDTSILLAVQEDRGQLLRQDPVTGHARGWRKADKGGFSLLSVPRQRRLVKACMQMQSSLWYSRQQSGFPSSSASRWHSLAAAPANPLRTHLCTFSAAARPAWPSKMQKMPN